MAPARVCLCLALYACAASALSLVISLPAPTALWAVPGIAVVILGGALVSAEMASRPRSAKFWAGTSHAQRVTAAALVGLLVALMFAGGGPTDDRPEVRAGRYVATQHGDVIRVLSRSAYDDLRMQVLRMALLAVGGLAALLWLGWITNRRPVPS